MTDDKEYQEILRLHDAGELDSRRPPAIFSVFTPEEEKILEMVRTYGRLERGETRRGPSCRVCEQEAETEPRRGDRLGIDHHVWICASCDWIVKGE